MGKGGGGSSGGGSTNIPPLGALFNNLEASPGSIEGGLGNLTTEENAYLTQAGGLSSLGQTGANQVAGFGDGSLIGSPYQTEGLGLAEEMGNNPYYLQQLVNSTQMGQYGQNELESLYGQLPQGQQNIANAETGVGNYQNQVQQAQNQVTGLENGTG